MPDILDRLGHRRDMWDTIDSPGQVVRNLLRGNGGAALRQGADFFGDLGNDLIPFADPIPTASRPEDYVQASDLLGMDENTPWWIKTPTNIVGGVLTDPLSLVSFGGPAAAGQLLKAGAKAGGVGRAVARGRRLEEGSQEAADIVAASREQALPLELERNLSPEGRAALREDPDLIRKMDDDPGNFEAASENVRGSDLFNQGGVHLSVPFTNIRTRGLFEGHDIDPLSLAGKAGGAVLDQMGTTGESIRRGLAGVRSAVGMRDLSVQERSIADRAQGEGQIYGATATANVDRILGGLSPDQDRAVTEAMQNVRLQDGRPVALLTAEGTPLEQRIAAATYGLPPQDAQKVADATRELSKWGDSQLGIERDAGVLGAGTAPGGSYLQRIYSGAKGKPTDPDRDLIMGSPAFTQGRTLESAQELVDHFAANPDLRMEPSARVAAMRRAEAGGRAVSRASLVREAVDPEAVLTDGDVMGKVQSALAELGKESPDFAATVKQAVGGLPERSAIGKALAALNTSMPFAFKKAAVSGVVIPRIASLVRNQLGGVLQVGSQFGAPGALWEAGQAIPNIAKAIADGAKSSYGKAIGSLDPVTLSADMQRMETAFKAAKGDPRIVKELLSKADPIMGEALGMGVLDNMVSAEQMLASASGKGWLTRGAGALWDMPAEMFKYLEQNMRLGLYRKLRAENFSPELAAQGTKDSFLDYSVTSANNRTLRDWVPFAAFLTQTLPQQARMLSRSPASAVASSQLFTSEGDDPIYPYMENTLHVPSGKDQQGNNQYITGTGAPVEAINLLPGSWDEVRQNVIGQANPLVKTALGAAFGIDPYFGTPFGNYDKAPSLFQALGADEHSEAGRLWNIAKGAGVVQPLTNVTNLFDTLTSDKLSGGEKALRALTGIREASVDENLALRQQLERALGERPDIDKMTTIYSRTKDPESLAMLKELAAIKKRMKEERAMASIP